MGARHPSPRVACSTVVLLPPLGGGVQDVAAGSAGGPHPSLSSVPEDAERAVTSSLAGPSAQTGRGARGASQLPPGESPRGQTRSRGCEAPTSFSEEFDARERALVEASDALRARARAVRRAMDSLARHLEAPVDEWTWLHEHAVELRLQLFERSVDLNGQIIDLNEAHFDWVLGGGFRAA